MIINCVLITIRAEFINNQDPSLAWIGTLNWIPFSGAFGVFKFI